MHRVRRTWKDLSQQQRRWIVIGASVEGALKLAVALDLRRRPAQELRGPKWAWYASLAVNSAGLLPVLYFLLGRRSGRRPGGSATP